MINPKCLGRARTEKRYCAPLNLSVAYVEICSQRRELCMLEDCNKLIGGGS